MKYKLGFLLIGLSLIALSMFVQARSFDIHIYPENLELQPGTENTVQASYLFETNGEEIVNTRIYDYEHVKLDFSTYTNQNFVASTAFTGTVRVDPEAEAGLYPIQVKALALQNGSPLIADTYIYVRVNNTGHTVYSTTPNFSIGPIIKDVEFSANQVMLTRNEMEELTIQYANEGSYTQFNVDADYDKKQLSVTGEVDNGNREVNLKIYSLPTTEENVYKVKVYLTDVGTSERFLLGEVTVIVKAFYNIAIVNPNPELNVVPNSTVYSYFSVENLSDFPQNFKVSSNSAYISFESEVFSLKPRESKKLIYTVNAPKQQITEKVKIILDGDTYREVYFILTVGEGSETAGEEIDFTPAGLLTGFVSLGDFGGFSILLLLVIFAMLVFLFIKRKTLFGVTATASTGNGNNEDENHSAAGQPKEDAKGATDKPDEILGITISDTPNEKARKKKELEEKIFTDKEKKDVKMQLKTPEQRQKELLGICETEKSDLQEQLDKNKKRFEELAKQCREKQADFTKIYGNDMKDVDSEIKEVEQEIIPELGKTPEEVAKEAIQEFRREEAIERNVKPQTERKPLPETRQTRFMKED